MIAQMRRRLHHALRIARGAHTQAFARKGHEVVAPTIAAAGAGKTVGEDTALQILGKRIPNIGLGAELIALPVELACAGQLKPNLVVLGNG